MRALQRPSTAGLSSSSTSRRCKVAVGCSESNRSDARLQRRSASWLAPAAGSPAGLSRPRSGLTTPGSSSSSRRSRGRTGETCTAAAAAAAGVPGLGGSLLGLNVLQAAKPVDRLRYQARMVFEHLFGSVTARLGVAELERYRQYVEARLGALPEVLAPHLAAVTMLAGRGENTAQSLGLPAGHSTHLTFEDFVDLFRQQIAAVSSPSSSFLEVAALPSATAGGPGAPSTSAPAAVAALGDGASTSTSSTPEAAAAASAKAAGENRTRGMAAAGKLRFQFSLGAAELAGALAVFRMLDFDNDGYLRMEEYERCARGLEAEFFARKLADADENDDGFLTQNEFLSSYAKKRAVFLNMAILASHTLVIWFIINLEGIDVLLKGIVIAAILYKPQMITNTVTKLYAICQTLYDRSRVALEMGQRPAGSYRPASG